MWCCFLCQRIYIYIYKSRNITSLSKLAERLIPHLSQPRSTGMTRILYVLVTIRKTFWVVHMSSAHLTKVHEIILKASLQKSIFNLIRIEILASVHRAHVLHRRHRSAQFSEAFTRMEDRLFPTLRKSGVTNVSVRLLHTTFTDGRSIMQLWMTGITSLEGRDERVAIIHGTEMMLTSVFGLQKHPAGRCIAVSLTNQCPI